MIITITLRVTVVPVVVVPVVENNIRIFMVVTEVRGRRDKVITVRIRGLTGTLVAVVVRMVLVMVRTVKVVKIINHTVVMVNSVL
tara:strand:+ start:257 stop:511 length:255 start_codon:yes stop_codon:yes gene_type:complete